MLENRHGALIKIVGTFSTRAYNLNTLYVELDQDEELSQLTVTLRCDAAATRCPPVAAPWGGR